MFKFNYRRSTNAATAMLLASLMLLAPISGQASAKDNDEPAKVKLHVEVAGVSGDGMAGSIDAFGSDQLTTVPLTSDSGGGGGAGKAAFGPIIITKDVDGATPKLFVKAASGFHIPMVKINWIRKNPLTGLEETYFSVVLSDVLITSLRTRLADQRDSQSLPGAAIEDVGFTFAKIQFFFFRPDGSVVSSGFDTKSQTTIN